MHTDRASITASAVAIARGVAGADDVAASLLPPPIGAAMGAIARAPRFVSRAVNAATLGLVDHIALRTAAIDAALEAALARGIAQIVVLGAGLDARAYRLPALRDAVVFEVDHPATQAFKRSRVDGRSPLARDVRFVAVDFERMSLADALIASGHDAAARTFWIWEGVTMYLDPPAMRSTLEVIADRSASESRLAATYVTPSMTAFRPLRALARLSFHVLGEPIRNPMAPADVGAALVDVGFRVLSDEGAEDWARAGGVHTVWTRTVRERLIVAEKRRA